MFQCSRASFLVPVVSSLDITAALSMLLILIIQVVEMAKDVDVIFIPSFFFPFSFEKRVYFLFEYGTHRYVAHMVR